jgi:hypothetical protein
MIQVENFHDPDWATARVPFVRKNKTLDSRIEIINCKTRMRYVHDEREVISCKAAMIATVGLPAYTLANVAFNVFRLVTLVLADISRAIARFFSGSLVDSLALFYEIPLSIGVVFWALIKATFCAPAMLGAAIFSVFSPLEGRVLLGDVERYWRGTTRKDHFCEANTDIAERTADFFTNRDSPYAFFLAYCFQPWGSLDDANVVQDSLECLLPNC